MCFEVIESTDVLLTEENVWETGIAWMESQSAANELRFTAKLLIKPNLLELDIVFEEKLLDLLSMPTGPFTIISFRPNSHHSVIQIIFNEVG